MALILLEDRIEYRIGIWKIEEPEDVLLRLSNGFIPDAQNNARRLEQLAVRALAANMGVTIESIAYLPNGKPYLHGDRMHISISHTKNYAAVMLSANPHIGIDIEKHSARALKIRKKFMHPDEESVLTALKLTIEDETIAVLLHWSAKEAIFKAISEEGVDFAQELRIKNFNLTKSSGQCIGGALRSKKNFQIVYTIYPEFVLTCCFSAVSK